MPKLGHQYQHHAQHPLIWDPALATHEGQQHGVTSQQGTLRCTPHLNWASRSLCSWAERLSATSSSTLGTLIHIQECRLFPSATNLSNTRAAQQYLCASFQPCKSSAASRALVEEKNPKFLQYQSLIREQVC